jgi:ABC-type multidrug transport system ATPase subunit
MPTVRIGNVRTTGGKPIVPSIGVSWSAGERVGLTGPSGCGKTTLLRSLVQRRLPDGLVGTLEHDMSCGDRIAYAAQRGGLLPWFTLERQFSDLRDVCESRADTARLCERAEITKLMKAFPDELSGGEYQRALIVRSLLMNAAFYVFDEPCMAVDIALRWRLLTMWSEEVASGCSAAIVVSHELDILAFLCDRVVVVKSGGEKEPREVVTERQQGAFEEVSQQEWFLSARRQLVSATQDL